MGKGILGKGGGDICWNSYTDIFESSNPTSEKKPEIKRGAFIRKKRNLGRINQSKKNSRFKNSRRYRKSSWEKGGKLQ